MKQKLVVFISLLIDLLAFTLILPLFPKIFEYYGSNQNDYAYNALEYSLNEFRKFLTIQSTFTQTINSTTINIESSESFNNVSKINGVLFGGFIGSLFSFLQFVSSALIGALSDIYGRKPVLLVALVGTLISYLTWSLSSLFVVFLLSRIIGGISKANVSICIAIMTDLSDKTSRSSAMALIGIAFSLGFIIGPCIGALFASNKLFPANFQASSNASSFTFMQYPAYLAICLTFINILFVLKYFNESLPIEKRARSFKSNFQQATQFINPISLFNFKPIKSDLIKKSDLNILKMVGAANFFYLFLYSGLEFTLTFLVYNRFNYDSVQQGKMFLFIGIFMTLIQGGYVRRIKEGTHIKACIKAIFVLIPAFVLIALATNQLTFYFGLLLYCYSSAVVVQCFTAFISNYGSEDEKGTITGICRSISALARAFGPIFSSFIYWTFGPSFAYILGSMALICPLCILIRVERSKIKNA